MVFSFQYVITVPHLAWMDFLMLQLCCPFLLNSRPLNLVLVRSHLAKIIIVKLIIQCRKNVTGCELKPDFGICLLNSDFGTLMSAVRLKEQRRRYYDDPDCMIWIQFALWSRCCVLGYDAFGGFYLSRVSALQKYAYHLTACILPFFFFCICIEKDIMRISA